MKKRRTKNKKKLTIREDGLLAKSKRFIIVILALIVICTVFNYAQNYIKETDKLKVLINSDNVALEYDPYIENGSLYIAITDIDKYLNAKTYAEKNSENKETIISTSGSKIARLTEGEKNVEINDTMQKINNNFMNKNGVYYIPISDIKSVYNLEIKEYDNIINLELLNKEKKITYMTEKDKLKYKDTIFSKTVQTVNNGEQLTVVEKNKKWTKVMTNEGNVGYVKTDKIELEQVAREEFNLHNEIKVSDDEYIGELTNNDIEQDIDELINNYDSRKEFITRIVETSINNRLKGVEVNFDNIDNTENYYRFLAELKPYLNDYGISLIVVKKDNLNEEALKNITNQIK